MKIIKLIIFLAFLPILLNFDLLQFKAISQNAREHIKEGNKLYEKKNYNDAEIEYRKSLEKEPKSTRGKFNLGASLYKQNNFEDAATNYSTLSNSKMSNKNKAKVMHNLGNSLLQSKKYAESIEAYKQALKMNPEDYDTKYNLEYAKRMMISQQNQQQQQNKDKNQDNNKQQNQQNQDKNQNQDKTDDKQKQNKDNQDNRNQDNPNQQKQPKDNLTKESAEKMLQALNNDEKDLQKKLQKSKVDKKKYLKNW